MMQQGEDEGAVSDCLRVREGFLNVWWTEESNKTKKRWIVFQGNEKTGLFQLKVFKDSNEKKLKVAYTVSKDTFVGIERGNSEASTRQQQRTKAAGHQRTTYLAFILATVTLVFQESAAAADLAEWHTAIEKYFSSNSWEVVPMTGVMSSHETRVVLHLTQNAMSLTTTYPPKHQRRWELGRVAEYGVWGARVYVHFDSTESKIGYVEMKASTPHEATGIGEALARLLPHTVPRRERKTSKSQLVPEKSSGGSISPGFRRRPEGPSASDRRRSSTEFTFSTSLHQASTGPPQPPPVSPRPMSSLAPQQTSPPSPTVPPRSPLTLALKPPPLVVRAAHSSPRLPPTPSKDRLHFNFP